MNIKCDILGLAEIRRQGECCSTLKSGHILYHKNSDSNAHVGGVSFLINKKVKPLVTKMIVISNRVIYLVLNVSQRYQMQAIQVNAPTSKACDEDIKQLYGDITTARRAEKARFSLIIGDFNAKVGIKDDDRITSMGNFGIGIRNPRGDMLLEYTQNEQLFCMNTLKKKKPANGNGLGKVQTGKQKIK